MRLRIEFRKQDDAKYIAHLDLTRVFERALRRAGMAMAYSEGFNPHPKIAFGSALAVGVEGEREYVDLELRFEQDPVEVLRALQVQMPQGIRLTEGRVIDAGMKPLMAVLNCARYRLSVPSSLSLPEERLSRAISAWLERTQVPYLRFTKKGRKEKDIRPWVESISGVMEAETVVFQLEINISPQGSVRPEEVIASLCALENLPLALDELRIQRIGLYVRHGEDRQPPWRIS
ncbi:MAG: TIGR03936 family radical SAM-associated protein [Peptococcaceae bacterium]|nr:TIGR03936 family radical SAM-associated protein [Peptococcaceae bacterium]